MACRPVDASGRRLIYESQTTARGEPMSRKADAVIIGAGVIGAATAYELARKGYKTLNIDKLPASGYGPTSASCAIVRAHYSSWDGVAMAYEGFFYWQDWGSYLGGGGVVGPA